MSVTSTEKFADLLERSNLLSAEQLYAARAELTAADEEKLPQLVESFAERGWLTRWQARMLLAGQHAFFLGRYKLLDHLGEGGMGSVLKAEQTPLGRLVAIKTLRKELVSNNEMVARFRREIQAAAALSHPNIVAAFDADSVAGQHFLVMEFVEGRDLSVLLKGGQKLPAGEACEYIRQAAVGLQHAHERGMVHRDIKPANLLLKVEGLGSRVESKKPDSRPSTRDSQPSTIDHRPTIKILDMGLARFDSDSGDELTQTGQIMGTPDYIAPEQGQDSKSADARSDIYSLGCTLFRLVTGRVPFERSGAIEKITARLMEEPPALRTVLPEASAELEAVLLKMMAREPTQRYQTAGDVIQAITPLAASLDNDEMSPTITFAAIQPIVAVPVKQIEPGMQEFLQHLATEAADDNPAQQSLAETIINIAQNPDAKPTPTAVGSPAPVKQSKASRSLIAEIAEKNRAEKRRLRKILAAAAALIVVVAGIVVWVKTGETQLTIDWPLDERTEAKLAVDGRPMELPESSQIVLPGDSGRRTVRLIRDGYESIEKSWDMARGAEIEFRPEWKPLPETVRAIRWSNLQKEVAAVSKLPTDFSGVTKLKRQIDADLEKFDVTPARIRETAKLISRLPAPIDALQQSEIDPYELRVAGRGVPDQYPTELVAVLGDSRFQHSASLIDLHFTPDGKSIVSAGQDAAVIVWDVKTGEARHFFENRYTTFFRIAVDPQSRWVAYPTGGHAVALQDVNTGEANRILRGHKNFVRSVAFSPDGNLLASCSTDSTIKLWNPETGDLIRTLSGHAQDVHSIEFSPDGKQIASASLDKTVRLWNVANGTVQQTIKQQDGHIAYGIAFQTGSSRLVIRQPSKGLLRIYDIDNADGPPAAELTGNYASIRYSTDGKRLVAASSNGVDIYDTANTVKVHSLTRQEIQSQILCASFSPDGSLLAVGCADGMIRLWDTKTWRQVNHPQRIMAADIDADGRRLAVAAADNSVRILDAASVDEILKLPPQPLPLQVVRFVPHSDKLIAYDTGTITCWDLSDRRLLHSFQLYYPNPKRLDVSPDGRLLAAAPSTGDNSPNPIFVWNLESGERLFELQGNETSIYQIAFNRTGKRLYSLESNGQSMTVWDTNTGKSINTFDIARGRHGFVGFEFVPDGTAIAAITSGNAMSVALPSHALKLPWQHRTHSGMVPHAGYFFCHSISPDCETLAIAGIVGSVDLYSLKKVGIFRKSIKFGSWLGCPKNIRYTPDGRHLLLTNYNGTVYVLRLQEWAVE